MTSSFLEVRVRDCESKKLLTAKFAKELPRRARRKAKAERAALSGGELLLSHLLGLGCLPNQFPELFTAGVGFGGVGEHMGCGIFVFQLLEGVAQLIVRHAIALGGDHQEVASGGAEKVQELPVALLRGDIGID